MGVTLFPHLPCYGNHVTPLKSVVVMVTTEPVWNSETDNLNHSRVVFPSWPCLADRGTQYKTTALSTILYTAALLKYTIGTAL
ncbi:hypothetical protein GDO78_004543 [Eleutherodactylus coqui]|uniref:Uncharacterized protein n=1 Tax=Eleutherodactylus coqui TaxID=57060 RepID=A0A8J6JZW6_ELECQ|nr:hypothetical protein GDO78_004543 [Eleutherodactylus coqui]